MIKIIKDILIRLQNCKSLPMLVRKMFENCTLYATLTQTNKHVNGDGYKSLNGSISFS